MRYLQLLGVILLVAGFMIALASASVAQAEPNSAPPSDAATGEKTWAAKPCKSCHGDLAQGKYAGPLAGITKTVTEALTQVRTPRAQMPVFTSTLISDQDVRDMYDYWRSLTRPVTVTLLRYEAKAGDDPGKVLFNQKRCVACHGEDGAGVVLGRGGNTLSEADVLKQVRTPRRNMPVFKTDWVTDADIKVIAAFLKPVVERAAAQPVTTTVAVTTTAPVTATRPATPTTAAPTTTAPVTTTRPATPTVAAPVTTTRPATPTVAAPVTATRPATPTVAAPVAPTAVPPPTVPATGGEVAALPWALVAGAGGALLIAAGRMLRRRR